MPEFESHQLIKQIPGVHVINIDFVSQTSTFMEGTSSEGWEIIQEGANQQTWVWRGYIDLAGWTKDELTNFIQTVDVQRSFPTTAANGATNVFEYDFVSSRKISDAELLPPTLGVPGFLPMLGFDGGVDIMQLIYGEWISQSQSAAETFTLVTTAADSFGGGSPIATDKLHITRLISVLGTGDSGTFSVYPVNYVINSITTEEKDLVWMERLRRSYVLQGGAD